MIRKPVLPMAAFAVSAAMIVQALPASARSAADIATLEQGLPVVAVAHVDGPIDGEVTAAIDVPAPPSAVWSTLTECASANTFLPNLKKCTILEGDTSAGADVREHRVASWASFLPDLRSVFRSEYETERRIAFQQITGDLEHMDGEWRLEPLPGGRSTRVSYVARVGFHPLVPGFLVRNSLKSDVPTFLTTIRDEAVRRAAAKAG
ncbi:MAG: SRPBCC family protein [Hyphomicrobium sp.]|nr:SRPBCC family protein [Hyphomicrobium sp.]